jgi:hypothetical protein
MDALIDAVLPIIVMLLHWEGSQYGIRKDVVRSQ